MCFRQLQPEPDAGAGGTAAGFVFGEGDGQMSFSLGEIVGFQLAVTLDPVEFTLFMPLLDVRRGPGNQLRRSFKLEPQFKHGGNPFDIGGLRTRL